LFESIATDLVAFIRFFKLGSLLFTFAFVAGVVVVVAVLIDGRLI
jgi:hypothetical protein